MDQIFEKRCAKMAPTVIRALESRRMKGYYAKDKKEARNLLLSLLDKEKTIAWGGSETIKSLDVLDLLKSEYKVIDRDLGKNDEERQEIMRQSLLSHTYITSANAISKDGILVHIDGIGNRVAAITYGPKEVIMVVGMQKVMDTVEDAYTRARHYAAPMNANRIESENTGCMITGFCTQCKVEMTACSSILFTRMSRIKDRIKVILVGEPLGY